MKHIILFLIFSFLLSCDCEDLLPTTPDNIPDPFQVQEDFGLGPDGNLFFSSFPLNKFVNDSSVVKNKSVLVEGSDSIISIDIQNNVFSSTLFISGTINGCGPNTFPCNGTITVTLKGTGDDVIKSIDGQVLDGDRNNVDGGDFVETFTF